MLTGLDPLPPAHPHARRQYPGALKGCGVIKMYLKSIFSKRLSVSLECLYQGHKSMWDQSILPDQVHLLHASLVYGIKLLAAELWSIWLNLGTLKDSLSSMKYNRTTTNFKSERLVVTDERISVTNIEKRNACKAWDYFDYIKSYSFI